MTAPARGAPTAKLVQRVADELDALGVRRVAVAVSGGLDSVCLLRLVVAAGIDCVALHVDHGLRPDSGADGVFVAALADELGVPCRVEHAPPGEGNVQAEARAARYAALETAAHALGCDAVATAHTADDQAETLLLALVRGAGLRGLAGMPPARPLTDATQRTDITLVRPLLQTSRDELERVAADNGWGWREDASNAGDAYRRNRIRHHVLPLLEAEGGPGTARRIAAAAATVRSALNAGPSALLRAVGVPDARGGSLPTAALARLDASARRALWSEALAAWTDGPRSAALVERVDALLVAAVGRRVDAGRWTAWRDRERIRLTRPADAPETLRADGSPPWVLAHSRGTLCAEASATHSPGQVPPEKSPLHLGEPGEDHSIDRIGRTEILDAAVFADGALLRSWRPGDRMRPLGGGSRLVSDLLTDARVPPSERGDVLVLVADGAIAWLVGHRIGKRAAIGDATRETVRLVWMPEIRPSAPPSGP